jgi:RHS repeat-associated protein
MTMGYDSQDRRIWKKTFAWDASLNGGAGDWSGTPQQYLKFAYDGMNLVAEFSSDGTTDRLLQTYAWGQNLGGGIGGLLSITDYSDTMPKTYLPFYDGNGNVTGLTDAADGSVAATYDYDPFGNLTASSGPAANVNPFRFSTKYFDSETGLYNYGYRFYSPAQGRFVTRDPSGEFNGGANLYVFVHNDPVNRTDALGLDDQGVMGWIRNIAYRGSPVYLLAQASKNTPPGSPTPEIAGAFGKTSMPMPVFPAIAQSGAYHAGIAVVATYDRLFDQFVEGPLNLLYEMHVSAGDGMLLGAGQSRPLAPKKTDGPTVLQRLQAFRESWWDGQWGHVPSMLKDVRMYDAGLISEEEFDARLGSKVFNDVLVVLPLKGAVLDGVSGRLYPLNSRLTTATRFSDLITSKYTDLYNQSAAKVFEDFNAGRIVVGPGQSARAVIGGRIDALTRVRLTRYLRAEGIAEGPGTSILVNRRLYDPLGSGLYRVPDVYLPNDRLILDGTIGKSFNSPQVQEFVGFSLGAEVKLIFPITPLPVH